mgnify:CR=1 FL=1
MIWFIAGTVLVLAALITLGRLLADELGRAS